MAEIEIPDSYGVATMTWANATLSSPVSCTMAYRVLGGSADPDAEAERIWGYWTGIAAPCTASKMRVTWSFESVSVLQRRIDGVLEASTFSAPIAGTMAGTDGLQPAYSPLCVAKITANAGRQFRGRMYPPMTWGGEASVALQGQIDTVAALPSIRAAYGAMFSDWDGSLGGPVLLHSNPATLPTSITGLIVRPVVATQRRRKAR